MDSKSNDNSSRLRLTQSRLAVVILLVVLVSVAVPGYWSGWSWSSLPKADLSQLKSLRGTGLTLPGWQTLDQAEVTIGSHEWSGQIIQQQQIATLFLLPQTFSREQPEVEWMDIQGAERWKSDSYRRLSFTLNATPPGQKVQARFFRAWNRRETYGVVQWYAWSNGGHFAPVRWFWLIS